MNTDNLTGLDAIRRIALAYDEAKDELPFIPKDKILTIRRLIEDQFAWLVWTWGLHIDFTEEDPYDYKEGGLIHLIDDYKDRIIRVNTSGNESKFWGPFYNLAFRAIHDFIHASKEWGFTYADEINAYEDQLKFYVFPLVDERELNLYERVLRSEICYQSAVKTYFGISHVPIQKIILSDL